jgi:hypothetical protein
MNASRPADPRGEVDGLCQRRVGARGAIDGNEDLAEHVALLLLMGSSTP